RARKKPKVPAEPPPTPPPGPAILPLVGAAKVTPGLAPDKKVCPRCHTHVNADDVTCFFCGYKFPEEAKPPPYGYYRNASLKVAFPCGRTKSSASGTTRSSSARNSATSATRSRE